MQIELNLILIASGLGMLGGSFMIGYIWARMNDGANDRRRIARRVLAALGDEDRFVENYVALSQSGCLSPHESLLHYDNLIRLSE